MLKTSKEFDFVYKNSYKFRTEMLDICVLRANMAEQFYEKFRRLPCNLVGFSVSKKVGNAVERNLIKRRLRAICREFFSQINSSLRANSQNLRGNPKDLQALQSNYPPCERVVESSVDSASPSPLSLDSFSQKGCTPRPAPPTRQKLPLFAFRGRASLSPLLAKNQRSHYCSLDSDFLHHEAGEFSGASHKIDLDSADSQNLVKNNRANLICIFIAKSQILQTPFVALKDSIFATLKRQLNFRQDFKQNLHKKPRTSRHSTQNRAYQNHTKGTL